MVLFSPHFSHSCGHISRKHSKSAIKLGFQIVLENSEIWKNSGDSVNIKYWVGQKVHMFFSIKDINFIFTNNFIDLGILSLSAISHMI